MQRYLPASVLCVPFQTKANKQIACEASHNVAPSLLSEHSPLCRVLELRSALTGHRRNTSGSWFKYAKMRLLRWSIAELRLFIFPNVFFHRRATSSSLAEHSGRHLPHNQSESFATQRPIRAKGNVRGGLRIEGWKRGHCITIQQHDTT